MKRFIAGESRAQATLFPERLDDWIAHDRVEPTLVAIDGSKFKAANNRDTNFTPHKLQARQQQLDESIARYLADLDRADVAPDQQVSLTDPDARSMATRGRGTGMVGYNVQAAVEAEHHLIVAHEVTNAGHDRAQLTKMAQQTKETLGTEDLTVLADRGYFSGEEILKCEQAGMTPLVPKPITSNSTANGRFDKRDFQYDAERDQYRCPASQYAIRRFTPIENGMAVHKYWSSACPRCSISSACTTSVSRRFGRWEHEQVVERMQRRLERMPGAGRLRRPTVEHALGTLKSRMGGTHFLTKTLPKVRTEMSLQVLAYNLKRVIQILGVQPPIAAIRTA